MKELIFEVTEDLEGGYVATALGVGIHTQAENVEELKEMVRDAMDCYFEEDDDKPALIRLHFVRDEVLAV
jgi:predicted RNase H-like HicB family nuclease